MPDDAKKGIPFAGMSLALLALAFVIGFAMALFSAGKSGILYSFALRWEFTSGAIFVLSWAPAILLVSSALTAEASTGPQQFSGVALRLLGPALMLAALVTLANLLVLPVLEQTRNRFQSQSTQFNDSIRQADSLISRGQLDEAEVLVLVAGVIDQTDERFSAANDRLQHARIRAVADSPASAADESPREEGVAWNAANRFYLEALEAKEKGQLFDAHYLAKRSAALYGKRPEVRKLVDETWRELVRLGTNLVDQEKESLYRRKLDGYARFMEGDYLAAYRIYSELAVGQPDDQDIRTYKTRAAEQLGSVAFFAEEDGDAFSRADGRPLVVRTTTGEGRKVHLSAVHAAADTDAVYLRDVSLTIEDSGGTPILAVSAPFARLHASILTLRMVDRQQPELVWEPRYQVRPPAAETGQTDYALEIPVPESDARLMLAMSDRTGSIPAYVLATGIDDARRLGLDDTPLKAELGRRISHPFMVIILVLLGTSLGLRFRPVEVPAVSSMPISAPFMTALAIAPIRVVAATGAIIIKAIAMWAPDSLFITVWVTFLIAAITASLFLADAIAGSGKQPAR